MARRFEQKVVVITGAAGGIGRATAERFASEGARLALVDLAGSALDKAAAAIEQAGGEAIAVAADVSARRRRQRYVDEARSRFGGIDCFFNNAAIEGVIAPIVEYPEETWERVFDVNVKGVWLGLKHVVPAMRERGGGAIVITSSTSGLRAKRTTRPTTPVSTRCWGLTRTAAQEFAATGSG